MNYSGPVMLAVILFAILDWCVTGHKRFRVPVSESEAVLVLAGDE